jgi:hypothetical protein
MIDLRAKLTRLWTALRRGRHRPPRRRPGRALRVEPLGGRVLLSGDAWGAAPPEAPPPDGDLSTTLQDLRAAYRLVDAPAAALNGVAVCLPGEGLVITWQDGSGADSLTWRLTVGKDLLAPAGAHSLLDSGSSVPVGVREVTDARGPALALDFLVGPSARVLVDLAPGMGPAPALLGDQPVHLRALALEFPAGGAEYLDVLGVGRHGIEEWTGGLPLPPGPDAPGWHWLVGLVQALGDPNEAPAAERGDAAARGEAALPDQPCDALGGLVAGTPGGPSIAAALGHGAGILDEAPAAEGTGEIDARDPGGDTVLLPPEAWHLPDAAADLVPLENAGLAVVPTFVVGSGGRTAAPLPEAADRPDRPVAGFVIGLDEPPAAPPKGPDAAPADRPAAVPCPDRPPLPPEQGSEEAGPAPSAGSGS